MIMKKISLLLTIFFLTQINSLVGQSTFSKRMHFGFPSVALSNVETNDSCIYVAGIVADSIYPYNAGLLFAKYDFDGNLLYFNALLDTTKTYEAWQNTLIPLNDGNFILSGLSINENMKALLIKITSEGDTIFVREYLSPYFQENSFFNPRDLVVLQDNGFALFSTLQKGNFDIDMHLMRIDSLGSLLWEKTWGEENNEAAHTLIVTDDGGFILGAGAEGGGI